MNTISVYSFDPGSVNFAIAKVSVVVNINDRVKYYGIPIEWATVLTSKYDTTGGIVIGKKLDLSEDESSSEQTNEQPRSQYIADFAHPSFKCKWTPRKLIEPPRSSLEMLKAYENHLLTGPSMEIFRKEIAQIKAKNGKINVIIEPQIDQYGGSFQVDNHDLYVVTYMTLSREEMCGSNLNFVQWNGKNKSGLEGKHGKERKEDTAPVAINLLRKEGFEDQAQFIESLPSKKPREDVADAYLQARNYLLRTLAKAGYAIPSTESGLVGKSDMIKTKKQSDKFLLDTLPKPGPEKEDSKKKVQKNKDKKQKRKSDKNPKVKDLDESDSVQEPAKKKRKKNVGAASEVPKSKRASNVDKSFSTTSVVTDSKPSKEKKRTDNGNEPELISVTVEHNNGKTKKRTDVIQYEPDVVSIDSED